MTEGGWDEQAFDEVRSDGADAVRGGVGEGGPVPYEELPEDAEASEEIKEQLKEKSETAPAPAELRFGTLDAFVDDYLLVWYRRQLGTGAWCPQWWRHPEALLRFEQLWRSYEYMRQDEATGVAVWIRDFVDPFMAVLLSADGPLAGCNPKTGHSVYPIEELPRDPRVEDHSTSARPQSVAVGAFGGLDGTR